MLIVIVFLFPYISTTLRPVLISDIELVLLAPFYIASFLLRWHFRGQSLWHFGVILLYSPPLCTQEQTVDISTVFVHPPLTLSCTGGVFMLRSRILACWLEDYIRLKVLGTLGSSYFN